MLNRHVIFITDILYVIQHIMLHEWEKLRKILVV